MCSCVKLHPTFGGPIVAHVTNLSHAVHPKRCCAVAFATFNVASLHSSMRKSLSLATHTHNAPVRQQSSSALSLSMLTAFAKAPAAHFGRARSGVWRVATLQPNVPTTGSVSHRPSLIPPSSCFTHSVLPHVPFVQRQVARRVVVVSQSQDVVEVAVNAWNLACVGGNQFYLVVMCESMFCVRCVSSAQLICWNCVLACVYLLECGKYEVGKVRLLYTAARVWGPYLWHTEAQTQSPLTKPLYHAFNTDHSEHKIAYACGQRMCVRWSAS